MAIANALGQKPGDKLLAHPVLLGQEEFMVHGRKTIVFIGQCRRCGFIYWGLRMTEEPRTKLPSLESLPAKWQAEYRRVLSLALARHAGQWGGMAECECQIICT